MSAAASGRVFISYRRQEASGLAGRLYERLAARLGDDQIFMDVDTIALGVDFAEVITQAVSTCQVLLAVIGPRWLTTTDQDGRRRLDNPDDIVRLEIGAALERGVRVIPILVDGAVMPDRQELPENLAELARRNALSLRHESFRADTDRLLAAMEPILRPRVSQDSTRVDRKRVVSEQWETCTLGLADESIERMGGVLRSKFFSTSRHPQILVARVTSPIREPYVAAKSKPFNIDGRRTEWMRAVEEVSTPTVDRYLAVQDVRAR